MQDSRPSADPLIRESAWLRAIARREAFDADGVDDLIQEVYLRAIRRPPVASSASALRAWLRRVTRNVALDHLRERTRRVAREEAVAEDISQWGGSPTEGLELEDTRRRVRRALSSLREPTRSMVSMRYLEGLPAIEIALRLKVTPEAVRQRVRRGLGEMRALLGRTESTTRVGRSVGAFWPFAMFQRRAPRGAAGAASAKPAALLVLGLGGLHVLAAALFLWLAPGAASAPAPDSRAAQLQSTVRAEGESAHGTDRSATPQVSSLTAGPAYALEGSLGGQRVAAGVSEKNRRLKPSASAGPDESPVEPSWGLAWLALEGHDSAAGVDLGHRFGRSAKVLGDLNGDGLVEVVAGAESHHLRNGRVSRGVGMLWIASLDDEPSIVHQRRIAPGFGGFDEPDLIGDELFGWAIDPVGDLDGNGIVDLAVGAPRHEVFVHAPRRWGLDPLPGHGARGAAPHAAHGIGALELPAPRRQRGVRNVRGWDR